MAAHLFVRFLNFCVCVFLGSAAVVKDLDPGVRFVFCDFAGRCLEVCGSCGFESMLHFAWTLPAFANGSDLRVFCVYVSRYCK